jgi:lysophospholipase L1-like esterase
MKTMRTVRTCWALIVPLVVISLGCQTMTSKKPAAQPAKPEKTEIPLSPDGKLLTESAKFWLKKVEEFRQDNKKQTPGGIVLLGDSITQRFPVKEMFPGMQVINRGIGGDKIGGGQYYGLIDRLDVSVYDLKPRKLFILIGINDILFAQTTRKNMKRHYYNLLATLKKNCTNCSIYVQTVLPVSGKFAKFNPDVLKFNKIVKQAAEKSGFTCIDIHPDFMNEKGELRAEFTNDGLHLTPAGYAQWKKILMPYMSN